jgi:hypothetical protein
VKLGEEIVLNSLIGIELWSNAFKRLPEELTLYVFSFLDGIDLCTAALTCKQFQDWTNDERSISTTLQLTSPLFLFFSDKLDCSFLFQFQALETAV